MDGIVAQIPSRRNTTCRGRLLSVPGIKFSGNWIVCSDALPETKIFADVSDICLSQTGYPPEIPKIPGIHVVANGALTDLSKFFEQVPKRQREKTPKAQGWLASVR